MKIPEFLKKDWGIKLVSLFLAVVIWYLANRGK